MTMEQYIEDVIAALKLGINEKKIQEARDGITAHMDDVVKPAFEKNASAEECALAVFTALLADAFKKK